MNSTLTELWKATTSRKRLAELSRSSLVSNAFLLMVNSAVNSAAGFFFWIIATRLFTPAEVGTGSALISAAMLMMTFATLGSGYAIIRYLPGSGTGAGRLLNTCITLSGAAALIAGGIFIIGLGAWSPALSFLQTPGWVMVFLLLTLSATLALLVEDAFIAGRGVKYLVVKNSLWAALKILTLIAAAAYFSSAGVFLSWGLTLVVVLVISIFLFLPRLLPGFRPSLALDRNVVRQVRRFSFTNYVADFLGSAPSFVLPLIVLRQAGPESTAYFAIAWALAGFLALIPGALSLSLFAEGSREEERLGIHASRAFTLAIVLVPVVLVAVIFAPQILLLYGKSYSSGSVAAFRLLALAAFASAALSLYMSVARVRGKLSWVLAVNAVPAVVGIGFAYVGLNHWGIVGVAGAWLAVQTAGAVAATASLRWSKILRS